MNKIRIKSHLPCDDCGSTDALTNYGTHTHCFSCGKHTFLKDNEDLKEDTVSYDYKKPTNELPAFYTNAGTELEVVLPVNKSKIIPLEHRKIGYKAAEKYGVWKDGNVFVYPFYSKDGKSHVANQIQTPDRKGFLVRGGANWSNTGLFGQNVFPAGCAKQITITEGANDALACYEMQGCQYPVVAVKSAGSALKEVSDNFEYLNSFDKIVLCLDSDKQGLDAAEKIASSGFALGKVRLVKLQKAKDANDYLRNGWTKEFMQEWWNAPEWTPVGIQHAKDCWLEVLKAKQTKYEAVDWPWGGLNQLTYGIRPSELVTITANPKVGKTSILRETVYHVIQQIINTGGRVGVMFLEEPKKDTLLGLMSLTANKPLHIPDVLENTSEAELKTYFDEVYKDDKLILWDHFGSNSVQSVLDYIRYMANLGCKHVVLDHLSIIVSDQSGDERKQLDEIATKIKTLTIELGISVICVIHQNRQGQIRGTAGVEQLSNIVIKLYRDMLAEDEDTRNTMKVMVEMNRFSGKTGPACLLKYDGETGRLTEMPQETLEEYLERNSKKKEKDDEW